MPTTTTFNSLITDMVRYLERGDSSVTDPTVYDQLPRLINLCERKLARKMKVQLSINVVTSVMVPGTNVYAKPDRWRDTVSINFGTSDVFYSTVSRVAAAGVRTLTLDKPHSFIAGQSVTVDSVGGTGYNGTFNLTSVAQLTVTYSTGATTEASTADSSGFVSSTMSNRTPLLTRAYEYCRNYWPSSTARSTPEFYSDYDLQNWLITPTPARSFPYEVSYYQLPPMLDSSNQQNVWTEYAPEALLYGSLLEAVPFLKDDTRIPVWQNMYDSAIADIRGEDIQKMIDRTAVRTEA